MHNDHEESSTARTLCRVASKGRALCYAEDNRDASNHKITDGRDFVEPKNKNRSNMVIELQKTM